MKNAIVAAVLLGAMTLDASAQESGKAVAVEAGPPPSADYVWVAINGLGSNPNSVALRHTDGSPVLNPATGAPFYLTGGGFGFNRPFDIVGSPLHRRVFVSNGGANPGTVTVVNADSLQPIAIVTIPNSLNLRGMSLSEDESEIFVAGQDVTVGIEGPAVYRINTATLATSRAGGIVDPGRGAGDCVVIRAANAGGSGNGPGKVYFTSFTGGAVSGYVGILNLLLGTTSSIDLATGTLDSVHQPTNAERTPDHRLVFVCCGKFNTGFGTTTPILRIDAATDTPTVQVASTGVQDLTSNRTIDITWHRTAGGVNRGFALLSEDASAPTIHEIPDAGAAILMSPVPAGQGGVSAPASIRYFPGTVQLLVGELAGTSNAYNIFPAPDPGPLRPPPPPAPPPAPSTFVPGVGSDPLNFTIMSTPAVVIADITPRAGPDTAGTVATVRGAGFQLGLTALVGATPVPITFVDSTTATIDFTGLVPGTFGVTIRSPNLQTGGFGNFYRNFAPPGIRPLPTDPAAQVALPSAAQGYRLCSFPQYASLTALKAAFAAQLGPYNPVLYRVFFYRQGGYVELNQLPDDGCDLAGEAFWVLTRNGATLTLTEPDVRQNNGGTDRVIPISPGFNLISLPTLNGTVTSGTIAWADVHVTDDETNFTVGSPGGPVNVTSAAGLLLVEQAIEFVNGGYVLATDLVDHRGYWVRNLTSGPVYLVFQEGLITKPSSFKPSFAAGVSPAAGSMPPPPPAGMASSSSSGGCGLLGAEGLLLALLRAVLSPRRRSA
jgi:hypothetical protein